MYVINTGLLFFLLKDINIANNYLEEALKIFRVSFM